MRIITAILATLLLLCGISGCQYVERLTGKGKVARIGDKILYQRDIANLVPSGTPAADSVQMVRQYINTWALGNLLLMQAESQLSKEESDVSKEVEQFRSNLLAYRYETLYIEQRLDTAVKADECRKYYEEHPQAFVTDIPVVKTRVIKIVPTSVDYPSILKLASTMDIGQVEELEGLCAISAELYETFGHRWVGMDRVAHLLDVNLEDCCRVAAPGKLLEIERPAANYLIFIEEMVCSGAVSPLEYNIDRIKEIILSHRKQELLANLKQELLQDAVEGNKLIIY